MGYYWDNTEAFISSDLYYWDITTVSMGYLSMYNRDTGNKAIWFTMV